jgi:hypothetical protein
MGTVTFQLNPVLQENAPQPAAQPITSAGQTVNANQAQAEPAPQDFVTLSSKLSELPGARREPHWTQFDGGGLSSAGASTGAGKPTQNAVEQEAPQASAQSVEPQSTVAADQESAGVAPTNASPLSTPEEQLSQLDRTLQELGIDPQSISLFHRMAMLLYANNPAALKDLVQQLPKAVETLTKQASDANSASQSEQQMQGQVQTQAVSSGSVGLQVIATQFSLTGTQGTAPNIESQNSDPASLSTGGSSTSSPATQSSSVAIRLEGLGVSLTQTGGQGSQPVTISVGSSNSSGQTLDVTA